MLLWPFLLGPLSHRILVTTIPRLQEAGATLLQARKDLWTNRTSHTKSTGLPRTMAPLFPALRGETMVTMAVTSLPTMTLGHTTPPTTPVIVLQAMTIGKLTILVEERIYVPG